MKNSPLTTMLLAASAILVLGAVALCWLYLHNNSELRTQQATINGLNARQQAVNALVADTVAYSETHPAVRPILESAGITNRPGATPAAK
jgi:hypothetical protein